MRPPPRPQSGGRQPEITHQANALPTTATTEAIRIAETFLPRATPKRKKVLAMEILKAIELCEAELSQDIARRIEALAARL
jgi:hypothetical protein